MMGVGESRGVKFDIGFETALYQARLALDDEARLKVVRKMYAMRFSEEAPTRQSIDQLRRIEGARVREMYKALRAQDHKA
jgi:CRISP-associated protein Cas1